jgi:maltose-binding protein MalE
VPPVKAGIKAVPLLTVHGFMLTRYAEKHGVGEQAAKLVGRLMARPRAQLALANASSWFPANTDAAATVPTGGGRIRAIGNAGADGATMPNLPQAAALWAPYATAWTATTSGPAATPAKQAFRLAEQAATATIAQG